MMIKKIFEMKKPVLSFEIFPPKKAEALKNIDATLEALSKLNPDYISVTFGAGGSCTNNLTVELAKKIKHKYGIEPLVHLTCISHTKEEIRTILEQLKSADIYNILALRGDINPEIERKNEFLYASDLASFIKSEGDFCISGACYPEMHTEAPDEKTDILNLMEKVGSGVDFLISQLFFDNEVFYGFQEKIKKAGIAVPVEAGIMPVINKAQIEKMVSLCGASIPDSLRDILDKCGEDKEMLFEEGIAYAVGQIKDLIANGVDGIHIYTMNNPEVAKRICDGISECI